MTDRRDVQRAYDRIAEQFSETRSAPWPEVETFCGDREVATAIDVGCGNGRHTELLAERADRAVGIDASVELLRIARERLPAASFLAGDAVRLPLADDATDLAIYVATLHHLPSRELRRRSLAELARVLDGVGLVSAWSVAHDRFDATEGFDTTVDWTLPDGTLVDRYYHIYDREEFDADLAASLLGVERSWLSSGNHYAIVTA